MYLLTYHVQNIANVVALIHQEPYPFRNRKRALNGTWT